MRLCAAIVGTVVLFAMSQAFGQGQLDRTAQGTWNNPSYPGAGGAFTIRMAENGANVSANIVWGSSTCAGPWAATGTKAGATYTLEIPNAADCGQVRVTLTEEGQQLNGSFDSSKYGRGLMRGTIGR